VEDLQLQLAEGMAREEKLKEEMKALQERS
jgi:hypothetical protein